MSKSDNYTTIYAPCPCGNGRVLEHVTSTNNAYGRSDSVYELSCNSCRRDWVLKNMWLFDKEANDAQNNSLQKLQCCREKIELLGAEAIDQIFAERNFSDYKSEYAFLKEVIGLCKEGPIKYKKSRVQGNKPSLACHPADASIYLEEIILIIQNIENSAIKEQLNELIREYDNLVNINKDAISRLKSRSRSISSLQEQ
jgi:hypothetical protein